MRLLCSPARHRRRAPAQFSRTPAAPAQRLRPPALAASVQPRPPAPGTAPVARSAPKQHTHLQHLQPLWLSNHSHTQKLLPHPHRRARARHRHVHESGAGNDHKATQPLTPRVLTLCYTAEMNSIGNRYQRNIKKRQQRTILKKLGHCQRALVQQFGRGLMLTLVTPQQRR